MYLKTFRWEMFWQKCQFASCNDKLKTTFFQLCSPPLVLSNWWARTDWPHWLSLRPEVCNLRVQLSNNCGGSLNSYYLLYSIDILNFIIWYINANSRKIVKIKKKERLSDGVRIPIRTICFLSSLQSPDKGNLRRDESFRRTNSRINLYKKGFQSLRILCRDFARDYPSRDHTIFPLHEMKDL